MLGLGRMGAAMARRFDAAGHPLVVWNRDPAKAVAVASNLGCEVANSPAHATSSADVVVTSLADDAAVRGVYLGPNGVVEGAREGTVAVDTSTIDPETVREVKAGLDRVGMTFLDCPVSGSVTTVDAGELVVMAGGESSAVRAVTPILDAVARRVVHVGESGTGSACKLAVNALVHGLNTALAEALVLAERAGVDRAVAYDVFASGAGAAPFVQYKRQSFERPDDTAVAFSLDLVRKDMELITGLAERVGVRADGARATRALVSEAVAAGMGERDMSALAVFLRGEGI